MALRILSISPHYFIYQDSYGEKVPRREVYERENERNSSSRERICEDLLRPYLRREMTVLDFGCGPGYLAKAVSPYCKRVIAVDISCGVIACAKILNRAKNIDYYTIKGALSSMIGVSQVDFIYSFAVIQHVTDDTFSSMLQCFNVVLKPGGTVICHILLDTAGNARNVKPATMSKFLVRHLKDRYGLRLLVRTEEEVRERIRSAGFGTPSVTLIKEVSPLEDDIADQHLVVFNKQ
jgi:2-polyprenyl-3-methyl-5-hydroxy-6-metoxy-1,4-benzoquinol methylase